MKTFLRVVVDLIVFAIFIFMVVGVYNRFWLPDSWFLP